MEKATYRKLTEDISSLYIEGFDPYSDHNISFLKAILTSMFNLGDEVYFFGYREDSLLPFGEAAYLRSFIPKYFQEHGRYLVIDRKDEIRFSCCASLKLSYNNIEFIIKTWRYFYGLDLLIPNESYNWQRITSLGKKIFEQDVDGIKMLSSSITDFLIIKDLGGDSLFVNYKHNAIDPVKLLNRTGLKIEIPTIEKEIVGVDSKLKKNLFSKLYNFLDKYF